jgi:hypothetical protein
MDPPQVIDYLAKKGYTRTEAMLRMESASQEIDGRSLPQLNENLRPKYRNGFGMFVQAIYNYITHVRLTNSKISSRIGLKTTSIYTR